MYLMVRHTCFQFFIIKLSRSSLSFKEIQPFSLFIFSGIKPSRTSQYLIGKFIYNLHVCHCRAVSSHTLLLFMISQWYINIIIIFPILNLFQTLKHLSLEYLKLLHTLYRHSTKYPSLLSLTEVSICSSFVSFTMKPFYTHHYLSQLNPR